MTALAVASASDFPVMGGSRFDFGCVFLHVAPEAEAFEIVERVVHVVAVFVMDLAASGLTAAFARRLWFQAFSSVRGAGTCLGLACRVLAMREPLADGSTVGADAPAVAVPSANQRVRTVLMQRGESAAADWTCFAVGLRHLTAIILGLTTAWIEAKVHRTDELCICCGVTH